MLGADLTTAKIPIRAIYINIEMSRSMSSDKSRLLHTNKWHQTKMIRSLLGGD